MTERVTFSAGLRTCLINASCCAWGVSGLTKVLRNWPEIKSVFNAADLAAPNNVDVDVAHEMCQCREV